MIDLLAQSYIKDLLKELKSLTRKRQTKMHTLRGIPKFVFVCGKIILDENGNLKPKEELRDSDNKRFRIIELLEEPFVSEASEKKTSEVFPIVSEKLYNRDSRILIDLLSFEEILCNLSDDIILILESDGTKCELGAFAMNDELIPKLCVLNDNNYENKSSFISDGPIRKIKEINDRTIYLNFNDMDQFVENPVLQRYLREIREKEAVYKANQDPKEIDVKNLIYELMGILEILEPLTKNEIVNIYKELKDIVNKYDIRKEYVKRFKTMESVIEFMTDIGLLIQRGDFFCINHKHQYACYRTIFTMKEDTYDELRKDYQDWVTLNHKERWEIGK